MVLFYYYPMDLRGTPGQGRGQVLCSSNVNCVGITRALQVTTLLGGGCITTQVVPFRLRENNESNGCRKRNNMRVLNRP